MYRSFLVCLCRCNPTYRDQVEVATPVMQPDLRYSYAPAALHALEPFRVAPRSFISVPRYPVLDKHM